MNHLRKYKELNSSYRNELIFHLGCDAGFYSELNNMILAIIYCLKNRIKFSLYSKDANFGHRMGWNDFFLPFCEESTDRFHHKYNQRYSDPFFDAHGLERIKILYYRLRHKHTYLTSDLFYHFRTTEFQRAKFSLQELGWEGDLRSIANHLIPLIYRFNEETSTEIQKHIDSLELPAKYIGMHIRGGDKFAEHPLEECKSYITKAEQLSSLRTAYILTDDYQVVKSLKADFPEWQFYTLTTPAEQGYYHKDFLLKTPEEKKADLIKLFASMEILRKSIVFVGTLSSNPGMFLGMCMEQVYGIDLGEWTIW